MADAAQRVLMNEFKALSKETWTNIEVCYLKFPINRMVPAMNEQING